MKEINTVSVIKLKKPETLKVGRGQIGKGSFIERSTQTCSFLKFRIERGSFQDKRKVQNTTQL